MAISRSPRQYKGVRAIIPPDLQPAERDPVSTDISYIKGTLWLNLTTPAAFMYSGKSGVWIALGSGTAGAIVTINSNAAVAGNYVLAGTANQIAIAQTAGTSTFTTPAVFIAPGSIASTTTLTSGTSLAVTTSATIGTTLGVTGTTTLGALNQVGTANINGSGSATTSINTGLATGAVNIGNTTGNTSVTGSLTASTTLTATSGAITATSGNFVSSASGNGILLNSPTASGVAASPLVLNGRSGQATFTSVSIAAAADLTLTLTNSQITASTTQVLVDISGATTGSALSIKSKTSSAGSLAIVVTNGTGATTSTANIVVTFLVLNT